MTLSKRGGQGERCLFVHLSCARSSKLVMDDRALIDEYRAWCAAHLHPRRGATLVRALEDVVSAELKRGDPSRLVERMRACSPEH